MITVLSCWPKLAATPPIAAVGEPARLDIPAGHAVHLAATSPLAAAVVCKYWLAAQFDRSTHTTLGSWSPLAQVAVVQANLALVVAAPPTPSPPESRVVGQLDTTPGIAAVESVER